MEGAGILTSDGILIGGDSVPGVEPHQRRVQLVLGGRVHSEDPACLIDIEAGAQKDADQSGGWNVWHGAGAGSGGAREKDKGKAGYM